MYNLSDPEDVLQGELELTRRCTCPRMACLRIF